ncbi:hypothetical protein C8T65DRAFT_639890 [Cerioporus squamosus]|nr:hypothetical protein C8T65DRAFT_639890 [Cerioporus squamosus]
MDAATKSVIEVCIPRPPRIPHILYDPGSGEPSLQSMMGLENEEVKFRGILDTIRAVWRAQEVDCYLPYFRQDPARMRSVTEEVVKRLPYLATDYEDAWPVEFYLRKALKDHGIQGSKRRRSEALGEDDDAEYREASYCTPQRRLLPERAARKRQSRAADHGTSEAATVATRPTRTLHRSTDERGAPSPSPSYSRLRRYTTYSATASTASTSSLATRVGSTSSTRIAGPQATSRRHDQTSGENSTTANTSVRSFLRPYHLPGADADRLVKLLASMGVVNTAYLRVLAKMHGRDSWLREMRDKGELTEIQMRVLREILVRMQDA